MDGGAGARARGKSRTNHSHYLRYIEPLPTVPDSSLTWAARRRQAYCKSFCTSCNPHPDHPLWFSMLKHYGGLPQLARVRVPPRRRGPRSSLHRTPLALRSSQLSLGSESRAQVKSRAARTQRTVGLLLMRPQIVRGARGHYGAHPRRRAEGLACSQRSRLLDNPRSKSFVESEDKPGRGATEKISRQPSRTLTAHFRRGPAMKQDAAFDFLKN